MIKPEIKTDFMPENSASRPGYHLHPKFITVHNTGTRATAKQGSSFYKRAMANKYASVHFFVDNKDIIQMLPLDEVSWHAGDGKNGRGNRESISIEICEVGIHQEKANQKAAELIRYLLKIYPYTPIVPHRYWIKKRCPRLLLDDWEGFLGMIYGK